MIELIDVKVDKGRWKNGTKTIGYCSSAGENFEQVLKRFAKDHPSVTVEKVYQYGSVYYFPIKENNDNDLSEVQLGD